LDSIAQANAAASVRTIQSSVAAPCDHCISTHTFTRTSLVLHQRHAWCFVYRFHPTAALTAAKPDASSPQCDLASCARRFSVFARRHHCRRCGLIFCAEHSSRLVPLDQHARFHDRAPRFRACVDCFGDYGLWAAERARRAAACSPGGGDAAAAAAASGIKIGGGKGAGLINTLIAQSVPKDWHWSTF
jgi:hypothetical protein